MGQLAFDWSLGKACHVGHVYEVFHRSSVISKLSNKLDNLVPDSLGSLSERILDIGEKTSNSWSVCL